MSSSVPARRLLIPLSFVVVALGSAPALAGPTAAAGPNGAYDWPGMKKCGSFKDEFRIYVYASRRPRLSCRTATRVQKAFWGPERGRVVHGSGPSEYVTLKKYPGWRCGSGAGGGACRKGRRVAGYQN